MKQERQKMADREGEEESSPDELAAVPSGKILPLNSRRLTSSHLKQLAESLELPTAGSPDQLRQLIEGKLESEKHVEVSNVQVVIQESQFVELKLSLMRTPSSLLVPAVHSLPADSRTRLYNTTETFQATGDPPKYMRLYDEDIDDLDVALADATVLSPLNSALSWHFVYIRYGQRCELEKEGGMGPHSFGLAHQFRLERVTRFSAHLAMNFKCLDQGYSLFWDRERSRGWSRFRSYTTFV